jgi:hypothetical protein
MPAWIHDRAMSLKKDMEKTYGPEKAKQVAFAVATQQAHRLGKSPKTYKSKVTGEKERFGTTVGRVVAKQKFDKPKKEYQKTAAILPEWLAKPARGERLEPGSEEFIKNRAFGRAVGRGGLGGFSTGALAGGIIGASERMKGNYPFLGAFLGAPVGAALGTAVDFPIQLKKQREMQEQREKRINKKRKTASAFMNELVGIINAKRSD